MEIHKITTPGRTGVAAQNVEGAKKILDLLKQKIPSKNHAAVCLANELSTKLENAIDILNTLYVPDGQCPADDILTKY